jgi:hypothetical protein
MLTLSLTECDGGEIESTLEGNGAAAVKRRP